jgi:hypothetical protein
VPEFIRRAGVTSSRCYLDRMKRLVVAIAVGYVLLALVGRAKETAGIYTCGCYQDCWCEKPGLSLFRWVFPRFHHLPVNDWGVTLEAPGSS